MVMPLLRLRQERPPSVVSSTPAVEMAISTRSRIARVDDDGVDARRELAAFGSRRAEPLGLAGAFAVEQVAAARLVVPQGAIELERSAAVAAGEQAAGDRADPDRAVAAEGDRPQLLERRIARHVVFQPTPKSLEESSNMSCPM
jgi:hypothetical protein